MQTALLDKVRQLRRTLPTMPMQHAVREARWLLTEPTLPFGAFDNEWSLKVERNGFDVCIKVEYDYDASPTEYMGTFTNDATGVRNPDAWYLSTSYRDRDDGSDATYMRQDFRKYGYIDLADGFDYASAYAWAHGEGGMSRSNADAYAREMVADAVRRMTYDSYTAVWIMVRAYRAGVELGAASMGGIELAEWPDTDGRNQRWLSEMAEDLIGEAVIDAMAALENLCPAVSQVGADA